MNKRFSAVIFLKDGNAVRSLTHQETLEQAPWELVKSYADFGADEIMILDLSDSREGHEESLFSIKEMALRSEIPLLGGGCIETLEDIKQYFYAGCNRVVIQLGNPNSVELLESAATKYGRDRLVASFLEANDLLDHKQLVENCVKEVCCSNLATAETVQSVVRVPVLVYGVEMTLNTILETLSLEGVSGICGPVVNENLSDCNAIKYVCAENKIPVSHLQMKFPWSALKKNSDNMVPVIVQDYKTDEVLMMAYMNEEAYLNTIKTGKMTYYSRSRQELWLKGDTSGHYQYVKSLTADCDLDTILAKVSQVGAACHTGSRSCFFQEIAKVNYKEKNPMKVLNDAYNVIANRKEHPREGSYTNYLFDKGLDKMLKKIGEESLQLVLDAKGENDRELKYDISDFLYHAMVLMVEKGITWEEITDELSRR